MNYEGFQARLIAGLVIIENQIGNVDVVAHSYMIAVPGGAKEDYTEADIAELQDELSWAWSEDFGWTFSVLA